MLDQTRLKSQCRNGLASFRRRKRSLRKWIRRTIWSSSRLPSSLLLLRLHHSVQTRRESRGVYRSIGSRGNSLVSPSCALFPAHHRLTLLAEIVVEGYTSYRASTFCSLLNGEAVTLHRTKPPPTDKAIKKGKEDTIVRFKNAKGVEVGRVVEIEAEWISRLLDLGMASFAGVAIDVPVKFQSGTFLLYPSEKSELRWGGFVGDTVVLSLKPTIFRKAFHNPNLDAPTLPKPSNKNSGLKQPFPEDAAKETAFESMLAQRKNALNALFDRTNLLPIQDSAPGAIVLGGGAKGKGKSARGLLEKYDAVQKKVKKQEGVDIAAAEGLESEEGIDGDGELIDQNALNLVYSKAKKNDAFLPEMDPPQSFKLELRQYQKQALRWMSGMEGIEQEGEGIDGREVSMHPLWEEYRFPASDDTFYYNPYSGELSLEFPRASKKCRGGILADGEYFPVLSTRGHPH